MLNIDDLQTIDSKKMYSVYDKWPELANDAYNIELKKSEFLGIDHIVFAGMGGSGAIGDMFASILSETKIHVSVVMGSIKRIFWCE